MAIINLILLLGWFVFCLYMLHGLNSIITGNEKKINKIENLRKKAFKTEKEQLQYTKMIENSFISFPKSVFYITLVSVLFSLVVRPLLVHSFYLSEIICLATSIIFGALISILNKTDREEYYFIMFFLYCLFITISMMCSTFFNPEVHWLIILTLYVGIYWALKKMGWNI